MKVALCLSGHLRSYELTHNALQKFIIKPLQADVFIHTWETVGVSSHIDGSTIYLKTNSILKRLYSYYEPKQIIVESLNRTQGLQYKKYLIDKRSPISVTNMFYKIYKADQLRQNYLYTHDLVIRARPDLLFNAEISSEYLSEAVKENCLFLPDCGHFGGINDQFAFGSASAMKIYSDCYNKLDELVKKTTFLPEALLKAHLLESKVPVKFFPINYTLIRANGSIFDNKHFSPGIPELK